MTTLRPFRATADNNPAPRPQRLPLRWAIIAMLASVACASVGLAGAGIVAVIATGVAVTTAAHRIIA
ncbi:hypothetical protein [Rhodococcus sp. ADH]|uniref:hypothetical protein n=1 Tax=Rhodococcus sp. ADH TaxID=224843 RepID=UPI000ADE5CBC|nr:hypothetical protein [Rhodococcus sp. ADH]